MTWRRFGLNEHAFDELTTTEHWYWLGFLLADGCVFSRRAGQDWLLQVKLQLHDRHLVEALKCFLEYEGEVRSFPARNAAILAVHSKVLCSRLRDLGIVQRKSFDGHPMPVVPSSCAYAFVRGHFDGNGYVQQRTPNSYRLGFSGQSRLMRWLAETAEHLVGVHGGRIEDRGGCAALVFGRRPEVASLARWMCGLHDNGSGLPCLLRKRAALEPLLQEG